MAEKVKLSRAGLLKDITVDGLSREEMASKYGLPINQMREAIKQAGLKQKKAHKIMFELEEENTDQAEQASV